jgi:hypothetical protein
MTINVSAKDCSFEGFDYFGEVPRKGDFIQFWDARFLVESVTRILKVEKISESDPLISEERVWVEAFKCETK